MPFSGSVFTLPNGATTAAAGQIVQSAVWNAIFSDIQTGFTQVMSQLVSMPTGRNLLGDNGGMEIWQRGAGSSASIAVAASNALYTADRWYLSTGANQAYVVSATTGLTNPSTLAATIQRTAGQTGTGVVIYGYPLDTPEINYARGAKVTLSFVVKAGANWSPTSGTLSYQVVVGTGTPVKNTVGYTSQSTVLTGGVNLTPGGANTFVSVSSTIVVPITTHQMEVAFFWLPVGTAGTTDAVIIDDVQLEIDYSTATWTPTNFDRQPFDLSLYNCKRHYKKTFDYGVTPAQTGGLLNAIVATSQGNIRFGSQWRYDDNELRVSPTGSVVTYNPQGASANWQDITAAASLAATIDTASVSNNTKAIYVFGATAAATDHQIAIHITASAGI